MVLESRRVGIDTPALPVLKAETVSLDRRWGLFRHTQYRQENRRTSRRIFERGCSLKCPNQQGLHCGWPQIVPDNSPSGTGATPQTRHVLSQRPRSLDVRVAGTKLTHREPMTSLIAPVDPASPQATTPNAD